MRSGRRRGYPSDVTDEEWEFVLPYLLWCREDSVHREHDLREVFNARYVAKTGCPSRWVPGERNNVLIHRIGVEASWVKDHSTRRRPFIPSVKWGMVPKVPRRFRRVDILRFIEETPADQSEETKLRPRLA
jgi:hypothetical protein